MCFLSQQSFRQNAGRWLAIAGMALLPVGKLVHLGQECNGFCSGENCAVTSHNSDRNAPCAFGCQHHEHSTQNSDGDEQDSPTHSHDEHHCAVCSVLSHVTHSPTIVGLPDVLQLVVGTVSAPSEAEIHQAFFRPHSRGPPADV
jgi:hypothetical protein